MQKLEQFLSDKEVEEYVVSNKGFALKEAQRFALRAGDHHRKDLESAALYGLYKAAKRFDPGRNVKFRTYARHWILDCMEDHVREFSRVVRPPRSSAYEKIRGRVRDLLQADPQKNWSPEELAKAADTDELTLHMMRASTLPDTQVATHDNFDTGETLPVVIDPDLTPEEALERKGLLKACQEVIAALPERQRVVLSARLLEVEDITHKELGEKLGICKASVQNAEKAGLQALRKRLLQQEVV